jgi:hypothetical protein
MHDVIDRRVRAFLQRRGDGDRRQTALSDGNESGQLTVMFGQFVAKLVMQPQVVAGGVGQGAHRCAPARAGRLPAGRRSRPWLWPSIAQAG